MAAVHCTSAPFLRLVDSPDLRGILDRLTNQQLSHNTKNAYARAWDKFFLFCEARFEDPETAPAETVGEFLASIYHDGRSLAAIRSASAGLRYRFMINDRWSARHAAIVHTVLHGVSKEMAPTGKMIQAQAAPLGCHEMGMVAYRGEVAATKATTAWAKADIWMDVALASVMRDGMLRRSEAAALDWEHITRDPEGGTASGLILKSKTDQSGEGHAFYISHRSLRYLDAIGRPQTGPVFVSRHNRRMHPYTVCRRIKRAIGRTGYDTSLFSGHSPRVGMAQDLVKAGMALVDIQQAGRWSQQSTVLLYVRKIAAKNNAVARFHTHWDAMNRHSAQKKAHREAAA